MTITVNVNGKKNTHHAKLTYNSSSIGLVRVMRKQVQRRNAETGKMDAVYEYVPDPKGYAYNSLPGTAVKTYTGEQGYADTPPPWTPVAQDDWSGGRGNKNFDKDRSRFFDSYRCNTTREGEVIPGPWDFWATGISSWTGYWGGLVTVPGADGASLSFNDLYGNGGIRAADSFVAQTTTTGFIWCILAYVGSPTDMTIRISTDTGGNPDANVSNTTIATTSLKHGGAPEVVRIALTSSGMTATNTYWLSFEHTGSSSAYWRIGAINVNAASYKRYISPNWSAVDGYSIAFRVCQAEDPFKAHFFEYKSSLYAALQYDDGGASKLYLNGDAGVATAGNSTSLTDAYKGATWTADAWIGGIARFNTGTGSAQPDNWTLITDNSTNTLDFAAQPVGPAANTQYSIVGVSSFKEINSTSTPPNWGNSTAVFNVTDVLSVNHGVLFASGDSIKPYRLRYYSTAWTLEWIEETSAAVTYFQDATDQTGAYIWGATGGYPAQLRKALSKDWSGAGTSTALLTFSSTAINCGDVGERVRSMVNYGQYGNLHVCKEASVYSVLDDVPYKLGMTQMGSQLDSRTGVASIVHNNYLFFSYKNTVMRYNWATQLMDNVGPNKDGEGLPEDRLGPIVALASYENLLLAAVDGGANNYSSILAYNDFGWHELYRPPTTGLRIRSLYVQSIPGDYPDRLWFSCGSDIGWLTMASDPFNHPIDTNNIFAGYQYAVDTHLITSYYYFNQQDVLKLYSSIKGIIDQVSGAGFILYVDYRLDNTTTWTPLANYISSFYDTLTISSTYNVTGRRIQFRIKVFNQFMYLASRLVTLIIEALVQQKYRKYVDMLVLIGDSQRDLLGNPDAVSTYATKMAVLEGWAQNPYGVLLDDCLGELDGKYVKLDTPSTRIVDSYRDQLGHRNYVVQLRMYECATT